MAKKNTNANKKNNMQQATAGDVAVDVQGVTKHYIIRHQKSPSLKDRLLKGKDTVEEFLALDDVSFTIKHSETFGIIGSNGSGKSTLLKLIAQVLKPTKGQVMVNGTVSALLELGAGFHQDLTGRENIYLNASILGLKRKEINKRFDQIVEFSELERFIDMPVKSYSSGMYMRLGFSIAINVNPDILLVDEVLSVGDQAFQSKCYKVIYDFIRRGKTIIIVSHDLETISDLCKRVLFLRKGKIELMGDSIQVVSRYRAYVEELERIRIAEQQKEERKKIFKSIIDSKRKVVAAEEIEKLSKIDGGASFEGRFGSGDAEVTKIEMSDEAGNLIDFCKSDAVAHITLEVKFKNLVENPIFGIRITDHRNSVVYGTNSRLLGIKTGVYKPGDKLKVTFGQKINLIGGHYFVTISIGHKDGKTYCDWINNVMTINVLRKNNSEGIADLNSEMIIKQI
ncbi:MAG: ATP-binding cassette domain-containing protein [Actinobacteria bacterium]|nr:ATP-binding cassette domain-containing protein [Actinomycetota bacterium]